MDADFIDEQEISEQKAKKAKDIKIEIQFWVLITLLLISFGSKIYREDICNNFCDDPVNDKLQEIRQRY